MLNKAMLLSTGKKVDPFTTGKFTITNGYTEVLMEGDHTDVEKPFYGYNRYKGTFGTSMEGEFPEMGECSSAPKFFGREVMGFFYTTLGLTFDYTMLEGPHIIFGPNKNEDVEWNEEEWDTLLTNGIVTLINHTTGETFPLGFGTQPYRVAGLTNTDGEPNESYFQEGESHVWEIRYEPYEE